MICQKEPRLKARRVKIMSASGSNLSELLSRLGGQIKRVKTVSQLT